MPPERLPDDEIDRRGDELYRGRLRPLVEKPEYAGKQIVIDVTSGDYEIDEDGLVVSRRLLARRPDSALYGLRIGHDAVYTLGRTLGLSFS